MFVVKLENKKVNGTEYNRNKVKNLFEHPRLCGYSLKFLTGHKKNTEIHTLSVKERRQRKARPLSL